MGRDYTHEVILPRRVIPQPTPTINEMGDCGPCALGGVLGWPSPKDVYERLCDGDPKALSWSEMARILRVAKSRGYVDRVVESVPFWPRRWAEATFGFPSWETFYDTWWPYVLMALDAGYYALAMVAMRGGGPLVLADHWLSIVGARERLVWSGNSGSTSYEVLLSCSARTTPAEEWMPAYDFLKERGGYNVLLVRPNGEPL